MSLDVYLERCDPIPEIKEDRIFIRRGGRRVELTREQWDAYFPGRDPVTVSEESYDTVYWANITHNLGRMAGEKWCTACKAWHDRSAFGLDDSRASGLATRCLASRRVTLGNEAKA